MPTRYIAKNFVRLQLQGADELSNALIGLPNHLRQGVLLTAVRKAGRVMVPPLRRATPKSKRKYGKQAVRNPSGTLRKSTGIVVRKYRRSTLIAAAYIGHRWPKGAAAHLNELGSKERRTKQGEFRGRMPGKLYFRPVKQQCRGEVQRVMRDELSKGIANAVAKVAVKAINKSWNLANDV